MCARNDGANALRDVIGQRVRKRPSPQLIPPTDVVVQDEAANRVDRPIEQLTGLDRRDAVLVAEIDSKTLDVRGDPAASAVQSNPGTTGELELPLVEIRERARSLPEPTSRRGVGEEPVYRGIKGRWGSSTAT